MRTALERSSWVHDHPLIPAIQIPKETLAGVRDEFGRASSRLLPLCEVLARPMRLCLAGRALPSVEGRPLIFAHRGASLEAPENTIAAFELALQYDVDGIELDVRQCASGELVVFHDEDCLRMANVPLKIAEATFDELRALELPPCLGIPQWIPTLEEVLALVPDDKLALIEIKADRAGDPRLGRAVADLLRTIPNSERFFVHSFDPTSLDSFHRAYRAVPTALLIARTPHFDGPNEPARARRTRRKLHALALHPELAQMTPANVRLWKKERVSVWTVDDPREAQRLAAMGVNGIITNDPRRIREAVREATGF